MLITLCILIASLLPLDRPSIALKFAGADEHLVLIRRLAEPSVIGVASVSKTFLRTARGLLAPVTGRRHALLEFLLPRETKRRIEGVDLLFCDSVALPMVRCRSKLHYRLLASRCLGRSRGRNGTGEPTWLTFEPK